VVSIKSNVFVSDLEWLLLLVTHHCFKKFEISVKEQATKSCEYLGTVMFNLYDYVVLMTACNFWELALGHRVSRYWFCVKWNIWEGVMAV
jgi:hypothetical protein